MLIELYIIIILHDYIYHIKTTNGFLAEVDKQLAIPIASHKFGEIDQYVVLLLDEIQGKL